MKVRISQKEVTPEKLRRGSLFVTKDGIFAVKSQYFYDGNPNEPLYILLGSGEFAHLPKKEKELVRKVLLEE